MQTCGCSPYVPSDPMRPSRLRRAASPPTAAPVGLWWASHAIRPRPFGRGRPRQRPPTYARILTTYECRMHVSSIYNNVLPKNSALEHHPEKIENTYQSVLRSRRRVASEGDQGKGLPRMRAYSGHTNAVCLQRAGLTMSYRKLPLSGADRKKSKITYQSSLTGSSSEAAHAPLRSKSAGVPRTGSTRDSIIGRRTRIS